MKNFKLLLLGALAVYLLSITACKKNPVEVIPGSINATGSQDYYGHVVGTAKPVHAVGE